MKKIILAGIILGFFSCKNQDSVYEEYIVPNGYYYPAKALEATAHPGRERIEISWKNGADPKVVKASISWNNDTESVEINVAPGADIISRMIEPIDENTYSFLIRTYDAKGNASVPVEVIGTVYGEEYEGSLMNRGLDIAVRNFDNSVIIRWFATTDTLITGCRIKYTNQSGAVVYQTVPADELRTVITDVSEDAGTIEYQTTYLLPEPEAIDDVASNFRQVNIEEIQEVALDKSLFLRWNPDGLPYVFNNAAWEIENLWDNTWHPTGAGYATGGTMTYFTLDMGQVAKLSRFRINFRHDATLCYNHAMLKRFEVYGSATPDVNADVNTWQFLGYYETEKPSGLPLGQVSTEDIEYAAYTGITFNVDDTTPYVQYLYFQMLETWGNVVGIQLMELTLWGYLDY